MKHCSSSRFSPNISRLYNLMRTLTQAQKRSFKKYVGFKEGKEGAGYLKLFDAINRFIRSEQEPAGLSDYLVKIQQFQDRTKTGQKSKYLYDKILESMRSQPEVSRLTTQLLGMLQDINFLFFKRLYDECFDLIKDTKKLAAEIGKETYILELFIWERRVYHASRSIVDLDARFRSMADEEQKLIQEIRQSLFYNTLANALFVSAKRDVPLPMHMETLMIELTKRNEQEVLKELPMRARFWYHNSLSFYHEILAKQQQKSSAPINSSINLQSALYHNEAMINLSEGPGKMVADEDTFFYDALVDNYINLCQRLGEYEKISGFEQRLISTKNEVQFLRSVTFHHINRLLGNHAYQEAADYITQNRLSNRLLFYENRISEGRLLALRHACGLIFYIVEQFEAASDWLAKNYQGQPSKNNPTFFLAGEFMYIISLFQTGTYKRDPVRPLINFQNKLRRRNVKISDFHKALFSTLKNVFQPKLPESKEEIRSLVEPVCNRILDENRNLIHFAPIAAWLEARLNGTKVADELMKYY
ncbi:MAG: hypothetical protein IPJ82_11015 [Lewinellaceae bacterium]|nr:hypothetical protein [Lewinellaceae bacterium]